MPAYGTVELGWVGVWVPKWSIGQPSLGIQTYIEYTERHTESSLHNFSTCKGETERSLFFTFSFL